MGYQIFCVMLLSASTFMGSVRAQPPIDELIDRELPSLIAIYQTIHANPELSHYEEKTSSLVARELRSLGFVVTERLGKYPRPEWKGYGLAGVLSNGQGPTILIRAELDALPIEEKTGLSYASKMRVKTDAGQETGVMHACGHDLHLTVLLGTARVLVALKERWRGTIVLVGEPAEETLDGVKAMMADGLYQRVPRPDCALALHDVGELEAGKVGVIVGNAFASTAVVEVTLRGKGGHASRPHESKDPIVLAAQFILALQTIVSRENSPLEPAVVTVGSIQGGTKASIIPDEVRLLLSVRALNEEVRQKHITSIMRIARGTALAAGIPEGLAPIVKISEVEITPATYNDPILTERLAAAFLNVLGPEKVERLGPRMAGDTFGGYSLIEGRRIPSTQFILGIADPARVKESRLNGVPLPPTHSSFFAPLVEPSLRTGIKAMAVAVTELSKR